MHAIMATATVCIMIATSSDTGCARVMANIVIKRDVYITVYIIAYKTYIFFLGITKSVFFLNY